MAQIARAHASPALAAIAGLVWIGLGQIAIGQYLRGIVLMFCTYGAFAGGVASGIQAAAYAGVIFFFAMTLAMSIDAYVVGSRIARGERVGKWDAAIKLGQ